MAPETGFPRMKRATSATETSTEAARPTRVEYAWAGLRLAMGWVFLWPFLDKLLGLGFSTKPAQAWISGGSPTMGFLGRAAYGPFAGFYNSIAGNVIVDSVFMLGLLAIGIALLLGVGLRVAAASGAVMLFLMWTALLPPVQNPFLDDHLVYAGLLLVLAWAHAGRTIGLGRWWQRRALVQRHPVLE